jgi:O-antigen/teichoic acid export membrane protein
VLLAKLKNSVIYGASDFAVKSTNLLLTPFYLSRLSVEEFGKFAILVATYSLLQLIFNFGFQSGFIRYYYIWEDKDGEIITNIWSLLIFSSTIGLIIIILYSFVEVSILFSTVEFSCIILTSILFATIINNSIAIFKVKEESIASGILGIITASSGMVLILYLFLATSLDGLSPIILGNLIASIVGSIYAIIINRNKLFRKIYFNPFIKIFTYSYPLIFHNFFQWILNSGDRFILLLLLGKEALGGYFFCYQFAIGTQFLFRSVNSSLFPMYSKAANGIKIDNNIKRINNYYLSFVVVAGLIVNLVAPLIIDIFNLNKYEDYTYLIPLLVGGALFYSLYYIPMNFVTLTRGKTNYIFLITLISALTGIVINVFLVKIDLIFAGIASFASYLSLTIIFNLFSNKYEDYKQFIDLKNYKVSVTLIILITVISGYILK